MVLEKMNYASRNRIVRLKRLVADLSLEKQVLKGGICGRNVACASV
jgi:hypothetical protein